MGHTGPKSHPDIRHLQGIPTGNSPTWIPSMSVKRHFKAPCCEEINSSAPAATQPARHFDEKLTSGADGGLQKRVRIYTKDGELYGFGSNDAHQIGLKRSHSDENMYEWFHLGMEVYNVHGREKHGTE